LCEGILVSSLFYVKEIALPTAVLAIIGADYRDRQPPPGFTQVAPSIEFL
jgi:hypothetical protein